MSRFPILSQKEKGKMKTRVAAVVNPIIGEFLSTIWREDREVIENIMERGFRIAEVIVVLEKEEIPEPPVTPLVDEQTYAHPFYDE